MKSYGYSLFHILTLLSLEQVAKRLFVNGIILLIHFECAVISMTKLYCNASDGKVYMYHIFILLSYEQENNLSLKYERYVIWFECAFGIVRSHVLDVLVRVKILDYIFPTKLI